MSTESDKKKSVPEETRMCTHIKGSCRTEDGMHHGRTSQGRDSVSGNVMCDPVEDQSRVTQVPVGSRPIPIVRHVEVNRAPRGGLSEFHVEVNRITTGVFDPTTISTTPRSRFKTTQQRF